MVYVDVPARRLRPELLRDAVRGDAADLTAASALSLLANHDVDIPDRAGLLQETVAAPDVTDAVRAAALRTLAHLEAPRAAETVRGLRDPGEHLTVAAATTIGQLGEPGDLAVLDRLEQTYAANDLIKSRAEFAAALLAHRFGLPEPAARLPAVDGLPAPGAASTAFVAAPSGALRTSDFLAAVHRRLPWVVPEEHVLFDVACGGRVLGVAMRKDLQDGTARRRLFERPDVAAVVAAENLEHGSVSVALLVLTRPGEDGRLTVAVTRTSGDQVYTGDATSLPDGTVTAELRAVRRPGNPACAVRAVLSDTGLEIFGRAGLTTVEPRRVPDRRPEADPPLR
ncbi:HEAT repeat domain-containing protein [Spirillospora sp. CA-128828]|uniref:HEAT repeat domain-containing protein n=1 Tax=Spirillospora sp. CA-128828 TaxID=3240033 RepID=UPI003D92B44A